MVIVIVGPTGIGKTTLSIELAKYFNTEVISGDSVQVYKGLNIGSAKVTKDEMQGVKHHLIDVLEPHESYSVSDYQNDVRSKIAEIQEKGKIPIIAGGTGLYVKAVLYDYDFNKPKRDNSFLYKYEKLSNEELYEKLNNLDPKACLKIHKNNRKRVLRALELAESGELISDSNRGNELLYDAVIIGLTVNREILYDNINKRVDKMFDKGLVSEVQKLYNKNIRSNAVNAIGYKELYEYFDGLISLENAKEKIKLNTRRFAKKQYTWFNNKMEVNWIETDFENFDNTINKAINLINNI